MEEVQVNAAGSTDTANPTDETAPVKTDEKEVKKSGIVITWPRANGGPAIDEKFKLPPITGPGVYVLTGRKGVPDVLEWRFFEEVEVTLCLANAPKTGKVLFLEV
jgi:hypothetical protein